MRIYRNGIFLCSLMCIFSITPLILNIVFKCDLDTNIENLLLGIFASSFVALITYIGVYKIERKKTIGQIVRYCGEYILELSNLIPLLMDINDDGLCNLNWDTIITKIKKESYIHEIVLKLCKIHNERLYNVDGFYPILRKTKNNLNVHNLFIAFAKINCTAQYCDRAYQLNNNICFKLEKNDISYSDEELKRYIKVILQNNNDEYQHFLELVKEVSTLCKSKTIFDKDCNKKCL